MRWLVIVALALALLFVLLVVGFRLIYNPMIVRELRNQPDGDRAQKVMLIKLPSGKEIPVNYLRDPGVVYAASDSTWWRELSGEGAPVSLWIQGEELEGFARAIEDQPEHRQEVFRRLRPTAPKWMGVLVEIRLDP